MARKRRHLGEILYKAGKVQRQALLNAIKASKAGDKRLGQVLLESKLIDEATLTKALAKQFGYQYIDMDKTDIASGS